MTKTGSHREVNADLPRRVVPGLFCEGVAHALCWGWPEGGVLWQVCLLVGHSGEVLAVAFSPDGKRVVSGAEDSLVKIWDVESETEVCSNNRGCTL